MLQNIRVSLGAFLPVLSIGFWPAFGQSSNSLEFEVVSIKASPAPSHPMRVGCRGGPLAEQCVKRNARVELATHVYQATQDIASAMGNAPHHSRIGDLAKAGREKGEPSLADPEHQVGCGGDWGTNLVFREKLGARLDIVRRSGAIEQSPAARAVNFAVPAMNNPRQFGACPVAPNPDTSPAALADRNKNGSVAHDSPVAPESGCRIARVRRSAAPSRSPTASRLSARCKRASL